MEYVWLMKNAISTYYNFEDYYKMRNKQSNKLLCVHHDVQIQIWLYIYKREKRYSLLEQIATIQFDNDKNENELANKHNMTCI